MSSPITHCLCFADQRSAGRSGRFRNSKQKGSDASDRERGKVRTAARGAAQRAWTRVNRASRKVKITRPLSAARVRYFKSQLLPIERTRTITDCLAESFSRDCLFSSFCLEETGGPLFLSTSCDDELTRFSMCGQATNESFRVTHLNR